MIYIFDKESRVNVSNWKIGTRRSADFSIVLPASREQEMDTEQIDQTVAQMDTVVQQNAALVERLNQAHRPVSTQLALPHRRQGVLAGGG
ncbi:hypothetical protein SAMN05192549_102327 [Duganella sacchari]|uniref:Methyl-accepting chemotaxis protein n=1 Tax=Duganella sacchari TaxID=551987 RepID=A0A1M7L449_9BURK|nr:hypothetical protein SAMN05192549_102327 [Duganella sacchari]